MQLFVTIGNDWKLLTIVTKSFVLDVYGSLDPTLVIALQWSLSQKKFWGLVNRFCLFNKSNCTLSVSVYISSIIATYY